MKDLLGRGLDYTSEEVFATLYPALLKSTEMRTLYHSIGYKFKDVISPSFFWTPSFLSSFRRVAYLRLVSSPLAPSLLSASRPVGFHSRPRLHRLQMGSHSSLHLSPLPPRVQVKLHPQNLQRRQSLPYLPPFFLQHLQSPPHPSRLLRKFPMPPTLHPNLLLPLPPLDPSSLSLHRSSRHASPLQPNRPHPQVR